MSLVTIDQQKCKRDNLCVLVCPSNLFEACPGGFPVFRHADASNCIMCGHCVGICPHDAIEHRQIPFAASPVIDAEPALNPETFLQLMKTRRSVRNFKTQMVPDDLIRTLVDATRWAPTAVNRQNVHWLVIRTPAEVRRLAGLIIDSLRKATGPAARYAPFIEAWERGKDMVLRGAPHLAIVHAPGKRDLNAVDCIIALTHFDLAAVAHGLGTCWAGILMMTAESFPPLGEAIALPRGHKIQGAMMFGYPQYHFRRIPMRNPGKLELR